MTNNKQLLHDLMDIGGVATIHNLYSPEAISYKGSLRRIQELKQLWLANGLIKPIQGLTGFVSRYPAKEVFYGITREGAEYIGREDEYIQKDVKSTNRHNIEHESAKYDVALAFVRLYRDWIVTIDYKYSIDGLQPDIYVKLQDPHDYKNRHYFFVEVDRKKTIDRTFNGKLVPYRNSIYKPEVRKILPKEYNILTVFADTTYDVFLRKQQIPGNAGALRVEAMTETLATYRGKNNVQLPNHFLFMALPDFYRLNEAVWFTPEGKKVKLIN